MSRFRFWLGWVGLVAVACPLAYAMGMNRFDRSVFAVGVGLVWYAVCGPKDPA